jgi:DNA-binding CsgD family transcriptional regulator
VQLVHLFHHELTSLLGRQLTLAGAVTREPPLPDQLQQVLARVLEGDPEKQIAARLGISRHTVNRHMQRLYHRFGVHSRGELMALCRDKLPLLRERANDAEHRRPGTKD